MVGQESFRQAILTSKCHIHKSEVAFQPHITKSQLHIWIKPINIKASTVIFSEENKMVRLYNFVFDNESFSYDPK